VFNGGFVFQKRLRRILRLAGYPVSLGWPKPSDLIGIWGNAGTAHRGRAVAEKTGAQLLHVEDAFLRSLFPGRSGEPPLGLLIDHTGLHFDASKPSDLETLLATHPLDDTALLNRARAAMVQMQEARLSKYSATATDCPLPAPGYVLIVDQTRGDASVTASKGDRARFLEMLTIAREENPGARFLIKTHPETTAGHREGHFRSEDAQGKISIYDGNADPWSLLNGAIAVYVLSSQMGFEAILAGHKPRVFGSPFYAGWGLTQDEEFFPRRGRSLTRAQLFAAAMILYPTWYDIYRDQLCELETTLATLEAQARAWREDRQGWVASGMRLWKRSALQGFYGRYRKVVFESDPAKAAQIAKTDQRKIMGWGAQSDASATHVEDGFLRSKGLGAALTPPLSLVADPVGIYYDPRSESALEQFIQHRAQSHIFQFHRSFRLISSVDAKNLSKYNLSGDLPTIQQGSTILVPGQVEDDASVLLGSPSIRTNAELLAFVRKHNPDAHILWKPHPDVLAGLRKGQVDRPLNWADQIVLDCSIGQLLQQVDEVWTMTSLTGFEALLRGCKVTTVGVPFYAGWGLTTDFGPIPERRLSGPRPSLEALVHATLIDYPRYFDPVTGQPCPVEITVERLALGKTTQFSPLNRTLSKLQGIFASYAHLWRR
jgi:capsular polysaccharide export protein